MAFEYEITPEMKRQFQDEADEHLVSFEKRLVILEQNPGDREAIDTAFRAVHSIKGQSDYIGVKDINALAHALEDLMGQVRDGGIGLAGEIFPLLFEGLDRLREMNRRIADEGYEESDISFLLERLGQAKAGAADEAYPVSRERAGMDVEEVFVSSSAQHVEYIRRVAERVRAGESVRGARRNVLRVLKTFRTSAHYVQAAEIAALLEEMAEALEKVRSLRQRTAVFLLEKLGQVEGRIAGMGRGETGREAETGGGAEAEFPADILERELRVSPDKVDEFMNRIAELTVARNGLQHAVSRLASGGVSAEATGELRKVAENIGRIADRLQDGVMALRLVRINSLFERLPRLVRELAHRTGKEIELSMLGEETEIDRKVIELLVDPLVHLIRNAVDHGIEAGAERAKKGKPEVGTITVTARREGSLAIIEVIDDGRGLDIEVIGRKGVEKGLVTGERLASMSTEEVADLIFAPGFSTASETTRVSGRGVGLDVVRNNMKQLGGNVTLQSEKDVATRIRLQVPISVAVLDVLLVEAAAEQYALPFSAIRETIAVGRGEIRVLNRREAISYYGAVLALRDLGELLGTAEPVRLRSGEPGEELPVVVIACGGQVRGLAVDRIVRREGILVKPLEHHLAGIRAFSGGALLEDGSIVLVLDPMGLF